MSVARDIADSVEFLEAHGFAVVPREPTERMLVARDVVTVPLGATDDDIARAEWAAMIAASPKATP